MQAQEGHREVPREERGGRRKASDQGVLAGLEDGGCDDRGRGGGPAGATPSKAQEELDHHETEVVTKKTRKRVRFAENLPQINDGRHLCDRMPRNAVQHLEPTVR